MYKLISAAPSPYARKVRIALLEKGVPFELVTEVPWDSTTQTPKYNPLEKLPILIPEDGKDPVYESHYILDYIETKHPKPPMLSNDPDQRLFAKKVEVVADGICDSLVLCLFEKQRDGPSQEWTTRQMRKVAGGLTALATWVGEGTGFIVGNQFGLADIAVGAVCAYIAVRFPDYGLKSKYPVLAKYSEMLEARDSFKQTYPKPQTISDKIV